MKFKDKWLACISLGEQTFRTHVSDQYVPLSFCNFFFSFSLFCRSPCTHGCIFSCIYGYMHSSMTNIDEQCQQIPLKCQFGIHTHL